MKPKLLLMLLMCMALLNLCSAQPPFQEGDFSQGFTIQYPDNNYVRAGLSYNYTFHVFNTTSGYPVTNLVSCKLDLYNSQGYEVGDFNSIYTGDEQNIFIDKGNFSQLGSGGYVVYCNTSDSGGYASGIFFISPNGKEPSTSSSIVYLGIISILLLLIGLGIFTFVSSEHPAVKTLTFFGTYFFIMMLFYLAWIFSLNYFYDASFIPLLFKWLFIIMEIALFPLVVGAIVYAGWLMITIAPMKRMLNRGRVSDAGLVNKIKRDMRVQRDEEW